MYLNIPDNANMKICFGKCYFNRHFHPDKTVSFILIKIIKRYK